MLAPAPACASFAGANGRLASEFREIDRGGADDMEIQVFDLDGQVGARVIQLGSSPVLAILNPLSASGR